MVIPVINQTRSFRITNNIAKLLSKVLLVPDVPVIISGIPKLTFSTHRFICIVGTASLYKIQYLGQVYIVG